jgi:hypothetical protein
MGRDYVEHGRSLDRLRVIERHAMRDARAAVVTEHREALEAEVPHDLDLIERHGALRVQIVLPVAFDLAAVAVAAKVRDDDGVIACQVARDGGPRHAALRRPVQQQDRRTAAADHAVNDGARGLHLLRAKTGKILCIDGERLLLRLRCDALLRCEHYAAGDECGRAAQEIAPMYVARDWLRRVVGVTHRLAPLR